MYYGTASYYDCSGSCPGASCPACNQPCDGMTVGIAYPTLTTHPTPNYAASCGGPPQASCLQNITLVNLCNNVTNNIEVYDHGPGAACTVDSLSGLCCVSGFTTAYRLLDLTRAAYLLMGGSTAPNSPGWIYVSIGV